MSFNIFSHFSMMILICSSENISQNNTIFDIIIPGPSLLFCPPGAYVPLTMEGTVLVDGVLASCYASFDHHLAHIAMTPIRWFPGVMEWIFGWDNGSPAYVNIIKDFGKWIIPHGTQHKTPQL